jgi:hypothetical protein
MLKRKGQARPAVHMPTIIKRLSHQIVIVKKRKDEHLKLSLKREA